MLYGTPALWILLYGTPAVWILLYGTPAVWNPCCMEPLPYGTLLVRSHLPLAPSLVVDWMKQS